MHLDDEIIQDHLGLGSNNARTNLLMFDDVQGWLGCDVDSFGTVIVHVWAQEVHESGLLSNF